MIANILVMLFGVALAVTGGRTIKTGEFRRAWGENYFGRSATILGWVYVAGGVLFFVFGIGRMALG